MKGITLECVHSLATIATDCLFEYDKMSLCLEPTALCELCESHGNYALDDLFYFRNSSRLTNHAVATGLCYNNK